MHSDQSVSTAKLPALHEQGNVKRGTPPQPFTITTYTKTCVNPGKLVPFAWVWSIVLHETNSQPLPCDFQDLAEVGAQCHATPTSSCTVEASHTQGSLTNHGPHPVSTRTPPHGAAGRGRQKDRGGAALVGPYKTNHDSKEDERHLLATFLRKWQRPL